METMSTETLDDDQVRLTSDEVTALAEKAKTDQGAKMQLLEAFDGFLSKYVGILKGSVSLDSENSDIKKFKDLFISNRNFAFYKPAALTHQLQAMYTLVDDRELKQEFIADFLTAIRNFTPQKAKNGFLPYVIQYIRWKAKDKIDASMRHPLFLARWNAVVRRGQQDFAAQDVNPIDLAVCGDRDDSIEDVEADFYDGLSDMTLEWVDNCKDPLFKELNRYGRYLLYLRYKAEMTYDEIAEALNRSPRTVSEQIKRVIHKLRVMADRDGALDDPTCLQEFEHLCEE
jgi:RNA polymerase sigma factor (sigma-70 family)